MPLRRLASPRWLRIGSPDGLALAIMVFAGLNLNAIALLVSGRKSLLSPVVLLATLLLLWARFNPKAISGIYLAFVGFLVSYLVFGALSDPFTIDLPGTFGTYATTLLLVSAIYFWVSALTDDGVVAVLNALRWIVVLASVVTALSPLLEGHVPSLSEEPDRFSGLFENPDEAATVALYGVVLVLCCPARSVLLRVGQLVILTVALAVTFSKNGVLIAIAISVSLAFRKGSPGRAAVVVGLWIVALAAVWFAYDHELVELTPLQRGRVGELFKVLGGELDKETTTGRTVLLDYGMAKLQQVFPGGAGLGTFHALEGGYRSPLGTWLGIHNTYLMVLGEAGLVPFMLLLGFVAALLWLSATPSTFGPVVMGLGIVLFGNMTTTHNALAIRCSDVALGIIIALAARTPGSAARPEGTGNARRP